MAHVFDFIIVGGGPAGSVLAANLSKSAKHPSVLLVESGGDGLPHENRQPYHRFMNAFTLPTLDHGYQTVPQKWLGGRQLQYQRGKGLGGCSMINFMIYTRGPSVDWNRWADLVEDPDWNWTSTARRFRDIEHFHGEVQAKYRTHTDRQERSHGYEGHLDISIPGQELEGEVMITIDAGKEMGWQYNIDHNAGSVMGMSIAQCSFANGVRSTSEKAFLQDRAENLTIWTQSQVAKILFNDKTAVGIETIEGKQAFASKEIILTAGSIDSPKLLLLSGIGPAAELKSMDIDVVLNLPTVGKNASDHLMVIITSLMDRAFSPKFEFALDAVARASAVEEWTKHGTGPLAVQYSSNLLVFGKSEENYETDNFRSLELGAQKRIMHPEVPDFEIATVKNCLSYAGPLIPPNYPMTKETSFASHVISIMNPQSAGELTLQSKDPRDAPLIDPGYLNNPYDMQSLVAAVKKERQLMKTVTMKKYYKGPINAPASDSDSDIEAFIRENAGPLWHFSSTAKMGKNGDPTAVVDSDMKVLGVANLRVADISICPFSPNAHTQALAYVIGQTAADKIIAQYHLNRA